MISIAICGGQTINELRSQSLDLTQYLSRWITWGCPAAAWGVRRLTCLDLTRDLVLRRLSCLNLLGDLPVQGSQEVDSYEGQVILKDKYLCHCAPDIRIKLQQLQQQDPAASFR